MVARIPDGYIFGSESVLKEKPSSVPPGTVLDALVANSVDGVAAFDLEGRFTLWNAAFEKFNGVLAADVLGKRPSEVYPEEAARLVERSCRAALAGKTERTESQPVTNIKGVRGFFDRFYFPLRDEAGAIVGGMALVRDVTDRHNAELARQRSEELFRSVVEFSTDAIAIADADGNFVYANPALLRIAGYTLEELRGTSVLHHAHPEDLARAADGMMRLISEVGCVVPLEARWRTKGGEWKTLDCNSRSFLDREGNLHMVLHARDVTDAKVAARALARAEREVNESREKLGASQKLEAVGRLAGGVAHDLNNLLTVVLSCADILAHTSPPRSPAQDYINEITRASERGAALTKQLLTFSRKQPAQTRVVDLNAIVLDLQKMLRRLIGERIELVTALGDRLHILADPGQVEQVIVNLVLNARDALGENGGRIVLGTAQRHVREQADSVRPGHYVALSVEDDGAGMTEEVKAHLFEPFFTTKERGSGTGLGLATVYGIVKQSGGHVNAQSEVGEGTSFEVLFPRVDDEVAPMSARGATGVRPRGHEAILLAEDEAPLRRLVREVLAESGYIVVEASNAEEALRMCDNLAARHERVDLVLSDVVMPGMNGHQLVARVREHWPNVRALLMSGYDDADPGAGSNEAIVAKPFSASVIVRRVRELLDEARS